MFDIVYLSQGRKVSIIIDDVNYNEILMAHEFDIRIEFSEDGFSFKYILNDNEKADINDCDEAIYFIEFIEQESFTSKDIDLLNDSIQSLIMISSVILS